MLVNFPFKKRYQLLFNSLGLYFSNCQSTGNPRSSPIYLILLVRCGLLWSAPFWFPDIYSWCWLFSSDLTMVESLGLPKFCDISLRIHHILSFNLCSMSLLLFCPTPQAVHLLRYFSEPRNNLPVMNYTIREQKKLQAVLENSNSFLPPVIFKNYKLNYYTEYKWPIDIWKG